MLTTTDRQARIDAFLQAHREQRTRREREHQRFHGWQAGRRIPLDPEHGVDHLYIDCPGDLAEFERLARSWREVFDDLPLGARNALAERWLLFRREPLPASFPEIPFVYVVESLSPPDASEDDVISGQFHPAGAYRFAWSALSALTDDEVKNVIAHELAHAYRHARGFDFKDESAVQSIAMSWGYHRHERDPAFYGRRPRQANNTPLELAPSSLEHFGRAVGQSVADAARDLAAKQEGIFLVARQVETDAARVAQSVADLQRQIERQQAAGKNIERAAHEVARRHDELSAVVEECEIRFSRQGDLQARLQTPPALLLAEQRRLAAELGRLQAEQIKHERMLCRTLEILAGAAQAVAQHMTKGEATPEEKPSQGLRKVVKRDESGFITEIIETPV